ncbi:MAG: DMT family transporter [Myxococcota bacterium]
MRIHDHLRGALWILLASLVSNGNDILTRLLGWRLDPMQVAFCRFFFAAVVLVPILFFRARQAFVTAYPVIHGLRALLGFVAVTCWCYGVPRVPLAVAAVLAQTVPLFVLPMAVVFLHERVGWRRLLATLCGFGGILVIVLPQRGAGSAQGAQTTVGAGLWALVLAALCFAASDVLNKKVAGKESSLAAILYFAVGTAFLGAIPAWRAWQAPTGFELTALVALGVGGNGILYCLLRAFARAEVSALAPYKYLELVFAGVFGFVLFSELPAANHWLGAAIIVPATFAVAYYETRAPKSD